MAEPEPRNTNVTLLTCLVDEDDIDDSDYRFLVGGQQVKYLTTGPGAFRGDEDSRTFAPILLSKLLPPFPAGDWNGGHVAKDPKNWETSFVKTEKVRFAEVENLSHSAKLDELDFTRQERVRQRVHISRHPELKDGNPVLVKLPVWPWGPSREVLQKQDERITIIAAPWTQGNGTYLIAVSGMRQLVLFPTWGLDLMAPGTRCEPS